MKGGKKREWPRKYFLEFSGFFLKRFILFTKREGGILQRNKDNFACTSFIPNHPRTSIL